MTAPSSDTFTAYPPGSAAATDATGAYLFLVMHGAEPHAGGARYCLGDLAAVRIGRGPARRARIDGRELIVELPDRKLSSKHARLVHGLGGWELIDEGSKNGSYVDGQLVERSPLADGAEIELGQCLFTFCAQAPLDRARSVLDCADLDPLPTGLASLAPGLAGQLARVARVAASDAPVLLLGETGTGKEVLARAIHARSERAGAFVALNCGALPSGLIEGELFGHQRGAFTGAVDDHLGLLRAADGGTLLLDEIGDLPLAAQVALLRVLNEREVTPLGATRPMPVDFRLISATHRDLDDMIGAGAFREDLFARLGGFRFELPALRDRREDLGLILRTLGAPPVSVEAARQLYRYDWPRNIRELAACMTSAAALCEGGEVELAHLPDAVARARGGDDLPDEERGRRAQLVVLLRAHRGNVSAVARELGKARMQVQRWLKRYGLEPSRYRES